MVTQVGTVVATGSTLSPGDVAAPQTSRLLGMPVLSIDGVAFIPAARDVDVPQSSQDWFHTVEAGEDTRADIISLNQYSTSRLDWLILLANKLHDQMLEPPAGSVLRIPFQTAQSAMNSLLPILTPRSGVY
jgi:hypothetical protein